MVSFPHCKINLGLNVVRKRSDGYHDIVTCFYPVPLTDVLEIIPSKQLHFQASGNSIPGNADENLCLKAYALLKKDFDIPAVAIHLHKVIPTGAGLGGGSSDAAFTLRTLNEIFELNIRVAQLKIYASALGSDCAFFIEDQPMIGTGRGEELKPALVNLTGKYLLLVKPDIHVSTTDAYSGVTPDSSIDNVEEIVTESVSEWKGKLVNDFEKSVFEKFPSIGKIKEDLYTEGAAYACMSGSGSTVFGIFDNDPSALTQQFSEAFCWSGRIG